MDKEEYKGLSKLIFLLRCINTGIQVCDIYFVSMFILVISTVLPFKGYIVGLSAMMLMVFTLAVLNKYMLIKIIKLKEK